MHNNSKKANIICLSNQLWDFPLWTNKKHVMSRLSEMGFNVLFVDPPINTGRLFLRHLIKGKWPLSRIVTWTYTDKRTTILSPLNYSPNNGTTTKKFAGKINRLASKKFDPKLRTILWIYHVEFNNLPELLKLLKYDVLVYDCVDNYPAFPKYSDNPTKKDQILRQEEYLAQRADIIFASAPGLVDKLTRFNPKTYFTPNVGDFNRFSKVKELTAHVPEDIKDIPHPRIGFAGAVDDYKFDRKLVKKIVADYPNYSFVIIGLSGLKDKAATLKELELDTARNVYFLGMRDYKEMPYYYAAFDVFIIPYVLNDYTVGGCFPVKFHEGLAAGLPVVVTDLPAYKPFANVCYISKSPNDFSQNIRRALEQDSQSLKAERVAVAKENSWEGKVQRMIDLIDTHVAEL
jgi:glycosyltransferase involved in cell wall biosynthesis